MRIGIQTVESSARGRVPPKRLAKGRAKAGGQGPPAPLARRANRIPRLVYRESIDRPGKAGKHVECNQ